MTTDHTTDGIRPICARQLIGSHDVLLMTLDTLRYDVAQAALGTGQTPTFAGLLPGGRWERRHSPATFTYAAHHAFFAGFLPTPASPGNHTRLFAARFAGSATTTDATCVLDAPDIVTDLLLTPVHPFAPPTLATIRTLGEQPELVAGLQRYTCPFDMTGHPTITLPGGFSIEGLPIGIQLVATHLGEAT